MPIQTEYHVDLENQFKQALEKASKQVEDLTIPLIEVSKNWFQSNRAIFALKGPGQYIDLAPSTKKQKAPNIYPILRRSGALEKSITIPTDGNAISQIINKKVLVLGTSIPYASFLHFGTKKMPARPVVFIGPESPMSNTKEIAERIPRWTKVLEEYVIQKTKQSGAAK